MGRIRLNMDSKLDSEISNIMNYFRQQGFSNITKPDVLRLLIEDYKRKGYQNMNIMRKPKMKEWILL